MPRNTVAKLLTVWESPRGLRVVKALPLYMVYDSTLPSIDDAIESRLSGMSNTGCLRLHDHVKSLLSD